MTTVEIQQIFIDKYQAALTEMANEMLRDFNRNSATDNVPTILKHLNKVYSDFEWYYSEGTGKIWHTINIRKYVELV